MLFEELLGRPGIPETCQPPFTPRVQPRAQRSRMAAQPGGDGHLSFPSRDLPSPYLSSHPPKVLDVEVIFSHIEDLPQGGHSCLC